MAANGSVVDELVVLLSLDDEPYRKASKKIDATVSETEKKLQRTSKKQKERNRDTLKQNEALAKSFKEFGATLGKFAVAVGGVLGVGGGAAGLVALVTNFAGLQNGMTKLGVATGLSNRALVSWGTAAKSLGVSAESAQSAIAALAREQQAMRAGQGVGPQLAALSTIGVRIGPNTSVADALGQAQDIMRAAPEGQRGGMESRLASQGVSADVLAMLKSEKNIREEYTRAYAETADENKKAVGAVNEALSALGTFATNAGNALTQIFQPQIEAAADWLKRASTAVAGFVTDVAGAGGGVKGFTSVLEQRIPGLDKKLETFGEALDVVANTMSVISDALKKAFGWVDGILKKYFPQSDGGSPIKKGLGIVGDALSWFWDESKAEAHANGHRSFSGAALTPGAQARALLDDGETDITSTLAVPRRRTGGAKPGASELVDMLLSRGMGLSEAHGLVANWMAESSLNPAAVSPDGGAAGLAQWRGDRRKAFVKMFGIDPSQATPQQQIEFMYRDPAEIARRNKASAAGRARGGSAADFAGAYSDIYETPSLTAAGLAAERAKRIGKLADIPVITPAQLARANAAQQAPAGVAGVGAGAAGPTYNIANVNVSANNPQQFSDGMQRVSNTSSYGSAVR